MQIRSNHPFRRLAAWSLPLTMSLMLAAPATRAAQINVGPNGCTLEDAIFAANANAAHGTCPAGEPGRDVIVLEPNRVYDLSLIYASTDFGVVATPPIREALVIIGNGATVRRAAGASPARLLLAAGLNEQPVSLSIVDLTLEGGIANEFGGGGILFVSRNADESLTVQSTTLRGNAAPEPPRAGTFIAGGGGIRFVGPESAPAGSLTLLQAQFIDNTSDNTSGAGVLATDAQVRIEGSTFSGNRTGNSGGGLGVQNLERGGVPPPEVLISTSTFSDNEGLGGGGGIILVSPARLLDNTITGNRAQLNAGGLFLIGSTAELERNLIAGNVVGDPLAAPEIGILRSVVSLSRYNLIGTAGDAGIRIASGSSYDLDPTDIVPQDNLDAILAPLASNGGSGQTHALVAGSPAIDSIPAEFCAQGDPATDQRGVSRPRGAGCDIGAYEFGGPTRLEVQRYVRSGGLFQRQVSAQAVVTNPGGTPVPGLAIAFSGGGRPLCTAVSDANGVAECVIASPLLLPLRYDAAFAGDADWDASSGRSPGLLGGN